MSDSSTKRMIQRYVDDAPAPLYFASRFQSPQENFHNSENVEVDIERDGEDVAVVVESLSADGNHNELSVFTNKEWKPPIFKERASITAFDMIRRQSGQTPFDSPDYMANAVLLVNKATGKIHKKINRAVELMASQVLQEGKLTLKDEAGATPYTLDFKPKSSHIVTVGNDWGGGSETPLADIEALAVVNKRDGKKRPNELTFGRLAWQDFLADTDVQARMNLRRAGLIQIEPRRENESAMFQGRMTVGNYEFDLFTYDGTFDDVETGTSTPYMTDDLVIMTASDARLDLTFGGIPQIAAPDPRALAFIPSRMNDSGLGMDLNVSAWFSTDGKVLTVEVASRPLTIPTAIDTIGVLNTRA